MAPAERTQGTAHHDQIQSFNGEGQAPVPGSGGGVGSNGRQAQRSGEVASSHSSGGSSKKKKRSRRRRK